MLLITGSGGCPEPSKYKVDAFGVEVLTDFPCIKLTWKPKASLQNYATFFSRYPIV
jgi:hypothetical protein